MGTQSQRRKAASRKLRDRSTKSEGGRQSGYIPRYRLAVYIARMSAPIKNPYAQPLSARKGAQQKTGIHTRVKKKKDKYFNKLIRESDGSEKCRACLDKNFKKGHHPLCEKSTYKGKTEEEIEEIRAKRSGLQAQSGNPTVAFKPSFSMVTREGCKNFLQHWGALPPLKAVTGDRANSILQKTSGAAATPTVNSINNDAINEVVCSPHPTLDSALQSNNKPRDVAAMLASEDDVTIDFIPPLIHPFEIDDFVRRISSGTNTDDSGHNNKSRAPKAVEALIYEISSRCPKFEKTSNRIVNDERNCRRLDEFRAMFGTGSLTYEVPKFLCKGSAQPCPELIGLSGHCITLLRYELLENDIYIPCTTNGCHGNLIHERLDLTKRGTLTPVVGLKKINWIATMSYKCQTCLKAVSGMDPCLVASLPLNLQIANPCISNWIKPHGLCQPDRALAKLIERSMVTSSNAEFVADYIRELFAEMFTEDQAVYGSTLQKEPVHSPDNWLSFTEWIGNVNLPTADVIRVMYENAKNSVYTRIGVSEKSRFEREIQSVGASKATASDHTHEVLKNYRNLGGAKAAWTMANENGELMAVAFVKDTKMASAAHDLEQVIRRPNFATRVHYLDTYPNKWSFYQLLFGEEVKGRLGLFHFLNRIIRTLRDRHIDFNQAILDLTECIYMLEPNDVFKVERALQSGTLNGRKYSTNELAALKKEKSWRKNYSKYIRKIFFVVQLIRAKLEGWWITYKVTASEGEKPGRGRLDPVKGVTLFTPETRTAFKEALKNAEHIADVTEDMYLVMESRAGAKHDLVTYVPCRPESKLESSHDILANYANSGTRPKLADLLTLEGIARSNKKKREGIRQGQLSPQQKESEDIHRTYRGIPFHCNDSWLCRINDLYSDTGLPIPYPNARQLREDTGQRFLLEAFNLSKERMQQFPATPENDRCQCPLCAGNPVPLPYIGKRLQEELPDDPCFEQELVELVTASEAMNFCSEMNTKNRDDNLEPSVVKNSKPLPADLHGPVAPATIFRGTVIQPVTLRTMDWNDCHSTMSLPPWTPSPWMAMNFPFQSVASAMQPLQLPHKQIHDGQKLQHHPCCTVFADYLGRANRTQMGRPPHAKDCLRRHHSRVKRVHTNQIKKEP
jgi:hypothetical protein